MNIREVVEDALGTAKEAKTNVVRSARWRDHGIAPIIKAHRGDAPLVVMTCQHDRDQIMDLALVAAGGFGADVVAVVFEGWMASGEHAGQNPRTGERWRQGDMQDLAENHDGEAKGWVVDGLSVLAANRAGDVAMATQRMKVHGRRQIEWLGDPWVEVAEGGEMVQLGGNMPEQLVKAMNKTTIHQRALATEPAMLAGMGAERVQAELDAATVKWITEMLAPAAIVLWPGEPGSERWNLLRGRLPGKMVRF